MSFNRDLLSRMSVSFSQTLDARKKSIKVISLLAKPIKKETIYEDNHFTYKAPTTPCLAHPHPMGHGRIQGTFHCVHHEYLECGW